MNWDLLIGKMINVQLVSGTHVTVYIVRSEGDSLGCSEAPGATKPYVFIPKDKVQYVRLVIPSEAT